MNELPILENLKHQLSGLDHRDLESKATRACHQPPRDDVDRALKNLFSHCVYNLTKPKALVKLLTNHGVEGNVAQVLAKVWENEAVVLVEKARSDSVKFTSPVPVDVISHEITFQVLDGGQKPEPMTVLRLGDQVIEFDPNGLKDFYEKLELIQENMDALK